MTRRIQADAVYSTYIVKDRAKGLNICVFQPTSSSARLARCNDNNSLSGLSWITRATVNGYWLIEINGTSSAVRDLAKHDLDIHDRRPVDRLHRSHAQSRSAYLPHSHAMKPDRIRPVG
jgi:hypothetical protein